MHQAMKLSIKIHKPMNKLTKMTSINWQALKTEFKALKVNTNHRQALRSEYEPSESTKN